MESVFPSGEPKVQTFPRAGLYMRPAGLCMHPAGLPIVEGLGAVVRAPVRACARVKFVALQV